MPEHADVIKPVVFLRSHDGAVDTQCVYGETVLVLGRDGHGARVQVQVQVQAGVDAGWAPAGALGKPRAARGPEGSRDRGVDLTVTALAAHLFAEPTRKREPSVAVLPMGARLEGLGELMEDGASDPLTANHWWRVRAEGLTDDSDQKLFVQSGDVVVGDPPTLDAAGTVALAQRLIGRPYIWAGATSFGCDCSGLVRMLAQRRSVTLPHSAKRQFSETWPRLTPVGEDTGVQGAGSADAAASRWRDLLEPGDFLYFAMGGQRVDHVAIWAGEGDMIHASSGGVPACKREPLWGEGAAGGGRFVAAMTGVRRIV